MSKKLKEILGIIKAKTGATINEVASEIKYSRVHLSRLANAEDSAQDDSEIVALILTKYGNVLQGVTLIGDNKHFTADQLFHMYMKAMERQDKIMDAQVAILADIRKGMALESTQGRIEANSIEILAGVRSMSIRQKAAAAQLKPRKSHRLPGSSKSRGRSDGAGEKQGKMK